MAEATMGTPGAARPGLFLRNATGLVKSWSTFDAFVYSFWSVNLITLGLYGMSYAYTVPDGQVVAAILLFGLLTTFLVITYAMLVSVMPRTGGDYAWQSRVLGGGLGFVLSINPGSSYEEGMLMGAIVQLDAKKGIKSYQLVNG